jgi:hypothetical protein
VLCNEWQRTASVAGVIQHGTFGCGLAKEAVTRCSGTRRSAMGGVTAVPAKRAHPSSRAVSMSCEKAHCRRIIALPFRSRTVCRNRKTWFSARILSRFYIVPSADSCFASRGEQDGKRPSISHVYVPIIQPLSENNRGQDCVKCAKILLGS